MGLKYKPVFIVFEGVDGSGKSTIADACYRKLLSYGVNVWLTQEPTYGFYGKTVRKLIGDGCVDRKRLLELFDADRKEHVLEIKKYIYNGFIVICDRYYDSTVVYQGTDANWKDLYKLQARKFLNPDIVFFLRLSADEAHRRLKKRGKLVVLEDLSFQKDVIRRYDLLYKTIKRNVVSIDATDSINNIVDLCMKTLFDKGYIWSVSGTEK